MFGDPPPHKALSFVISAMTGFLRGFRYPTFAPEVPNVCVTQLRTPSHSHPPMHTIRYVLAARHLLVEAARQVRRPLPHLLPRNIHNIR
jgi:hypothetical protein